MGMLLNAKKILQWISRAILHGLFACLIAVYIGYNFAITQELTPLFEFGTFMYTGVVMGTLTILFIETSTFTYIHLFFYIGSALLFFITVAVFGSGMYQPLIGLNENYFNQGLVYVVGLIFIPTVLGSLEIFVKT